MEKHRGRDIFVGDPATIYAELKELPFAIIEIQDLDAMEAGVHGERSLNDIHTMTPVIVNNQFVVDEHFRPIVGSDRENITSGNGDLDKPVEIVAEMVVRLGPFDSQLIHDPAILVTRCQKLVHTDERSLIVPVLKASAIGLYA